MRTKRLLLFDIDGTLLSSRGTGVSAMAEAGHRVLGPSFSLSKINFAGHLDTLIFGEAVRSAGFEPTQELEERFIQVYAELLEQKVSNNATPFQAMPGVLDVLELLQEQAEATLGLLTGNYARTAPLKLRGAGIDPDVFVIGAFGDKGPTRAALVPRALDQHQERFGYRPGAESVLIIGDTPRDVACARANGCHVLAVATGRYSAGELREAGADWVADDLTDASSLLAWIGA